MTLDEIIEWYKNADVDDPYAGHGDVLEGVYVGVSTVISMIDAEIEGLKEDLGEDMTGAFHDGYIHALNSLKKELEGVHNESNGV